jgi:hypothetical protein
VDRDTEALASGAARRIPNSQGDGYAPTVRPARNLEQRRRDYIVQPLQRHTVANGRVHRHVTDAYALACGNPMLEMRASRIVSSSPLPVAGGVTFAQVGRGWSDWLTPYRCAAHVLAAE